MRIAVFFEKHPSHQDLISTSGYQLIRELAATQCEIQVYTTYQALRAEVNLPSRVQLLEAFSRWKAWELPRILPSIWEFRPDVLHFLQPFALVKPSFTSVYQAFLRMAKYSNGPAIVSSFFDLPNKIGQANYVKDFLRFSDVVTVANSTQMAAIKAAAPEACIDLLAPPPEKFTHQRESKHWILNQVENVIYIPGSVSEIEDVSEFLNDLTSSTRLNRENEKWAVVVGGGWGPVPPFKRRLISREIQWHQLSGRFFIINNLSRRMQAYFMLHSRIVLLSPLAHQNLIVDTSLEDNPDPRRPIIVSPRQFAGKPKRADIHVVDGDLVGKALDEVPLNDRLANELQSEVPSPKSEDHLINHVIRLYQRALHL